jgi:hypothetical protein
MQQDCLHTNNGRHSRNALTGLWWCNEQVYLISSCPIPETCGQKKKKSFGPEQLSSDGHDIREVHLKQVPDVQIPLLNCSRCDPLGMGLI